MKKILGIVIGLLIVGAIIGNAPNQKTQPKQNREGEQTTSTKQPVKREFNASYGDHPRHVMHVLLPERVTNETPFILFLHGGEWRYGDKKEVLVIQKALKQQGVASGAMNYRYASSSVHYGDIMQDINQATDYVLENRESWGINKNRLHIGGISAGGHLSLLYAYAYDTRNTYASVVSFAGPTDFTDIDWLTMVVAIKKIASVNAITGGTYAKGSSLPSEFTQASPALRIKNVPTLMIHGTADSIVSYQQSKTLEQKLASRGIAHKLVTIPGANHDMGLLHKPTAEMILRETVSWITNYTK